MKFQDYAYDQLNSLSEISEIELQRFQLGLESVRLRKGTLWVVGNGGSSATASHAVADFVKTSTAFGDNPLKAISISELTSLITAFANDVSYELAYANSIRLLANPNDAILAISVSGTSPNLIECQKAAKDLNLPFFSLVGQNGFEMASTSDFSLIIKSKDYQTVENAHMSLIHWFVKSLWGKGACDN